MPPEVRAALLAHAAGTSDEVVGVVLKDWTVVPLPNVAADRRRAFEVHPRDWMAVEPRGVRALYHSHPGGPPRLSSSDLAALTPGGQPLLAGLEAWLIAGGEVICHGFQGGQWVILP